MSEKEDKSYANGPGPEESWIVRLSMAAMMVISAVALVIALSIYVLMIVMHAFDKIRGAILD